MINITDLVEVTLKEKDDFLKVRETLTRIGVASKKDKTLYQSCHILHKQGKYYIVHFKELFELDGKPSNISGRRMSKKRYFKRCSSDTLMVSSFNGNGGVSEAARTSISLPKTSI